MFAYLSRIIRRWKAFRQIELLSNSSAVLFGPDVEFHLEPGSRIIIQGGNFKVGFPIDGLPPYSTYAKTIIALGKNATLIVGGDTTIAPGASIKVRDGGTLEFKGRNVFAHNLLIICARSVTFDVNTVISWNVSFIDDDGHSLENEYGRHFRGLYRPIHIGKNVGVQMNVQFPRGVTVGDNSIVACGTVVRRDLPPNSLVYQNPELRIKTGLRMTGRQKLRGSREAVTS